MIPGLDFCFADCGRMIPCWFLNVEYSFSLSNGVIVLHTQNIKPKHYYVSERWLLWTLALHCVCSPDKSRETTDTGPAEHPTVSSWEGAEVDCGGMGPCPCGTRFTFTGNSMTSSYHFTSLLHYCHSVIQVQISSSLGDSICLVMNIS